MPENLTSDFSTIKLELTPAVNFQRESSNTFWKGIMAGISLGVIAGTPFWCGNSQFKICICVFEDNFLFRSPGTRGLAPNCNCAN